MKNQLKKLNWEENIYKAMVDIINEFGKNSINYDERNKPYGIFDWDNTSIFNDVQEGLLIYQLISLKFKMTPNIFRKVITKNIPKTNFKKKFNNTEGREVNIDIIVKDIILDYKYLYINYKGFKGDKSLSIIKESNEYKDFISKVLYLYVAIGETFSADISYLWIANIITGMTSEEVSMLTEESNDYWLNHRIGKERWTSPKGLKREAGVVSIEFKIGIRIVEEQQNLYNTLMDNGFDVYICSASQIDVVKEFANNPKYGYNIPKENIYAMELIKDKNGVIKPKLNPKYYQTQGEGKVKTIEKFIKHKYRYDPIIVGGDSDGDVLMLSNFNNTKISLIINRSMGGEIGELCKTALKKMGKGSRRYFLQGRNENTGKYISSNKSILLEEKK